MDPVDKGITMTWVNQIVGLNLLDLTSGELSWMESEVQLTLVAMIAWGLASVTVTTLLG